MESEWGSRFDAYRQAFPEQAELLKTIDAGRIDGQMTFVGLPILPLEPWTEEAHG